MEEDPPSGSEASSHQGPRGRADNDEDIVLPRSEECLLFLYRLEV